MRHLLVLGLALLASAAAIGADKPIPQDTARMEKRSHERLEWNRRTLQVAYDKIGKKGPEWDEAAHSALDLAARRFSQQVDPVILPVTVHLPAKKAIDAGCKDPLILYLYARSSVGLAFPGEQEHDRRCQAAADAMSASAYSPYRRAVAIGVASQNEAWKPNLTPDDRRKLERQLDAVLGLLPASVAEDPRNEDWEEGWYGWINSVIAMHRQLIGDYKAAFDRVDAHLAKVPKIEALRLTVKGNFLLHWGWEARTNAFASGVTEQQFRTFEARLQEARAALKDAWKLKPGQPQVATLMLDLEKAIGDGDREAMETWFERAMQSDGNDEEACWVKLDWLDPKWHGGDTPDQMMAFGKACRATKNWRAGITLIAADAHLRYYSKLPTNQEKQAYMRSPEVWSEIKSVYDEYLKHYPRDDTALSKYAMLCYLGGHYPEAHAQFEAVGNRLTQWSRFPYMPLETMKKARDETARIVARKPR